MPSMTVSTVSMPYFAIVSCNPLTPTLLAAIKPFKSRLMLVDRRDMPVMKLSTSVRSSPRSTSFTGGISMPSWRMSFAIDANEPATIPPTSSWCAQPPVQPMRLPSWKMSEHADIRTMQARPCADD